MLTVVVPSIELFDEKTYEFFNIKETVLQLEHSLLSISKWESTWKKPFLSKEQKSDEETADYIRCMSLTKNVDPIVYKHIPYNEYRRIIEYIEDEMTATTFSNVQKNSNEIITSEIIYYDMIALNIPFSCEKWHLNRLLTLIRVCNLKNQPDKKMGKKDVYKQNRALNAARRSKIRSRG